MTPPFDVKELHPADLTSASVPDQITRCVRAREHIAELTLERDTLRDSCEKALAAYDSAYETGKSSWRGEDVDKMRAAVIASKKEKK